MARYTITAALPYANGPIHIGHLAGVYIPADIFVRYLRNKGNDVLFICGSDEHGVPISFKAKKEGTTPKKIVDKYHTMIKESLIKFTISFDNYSRTTSEIHRSITINIFNKLYKDNCFSEKNTDQYYDETYNQFLADRYILGICPYCNNKEAYGDQCEKCGNSLNPNELIHPKSVLSHNSPVLRKTKHLYLPLDRYEKFLINWIMEKRVKINVYGQVKSWINNGLHPRSITRDLDWGVNLPLKEYAKKVLYVWFEAPIGYISSTIEWAIKKNKTWEIYWKDYDTKLINFIGKDNIVFHCLIFPVMLKASGSYILPYNVSANEFLNLENKKISTSRKWAVWLHEYLDEFNNQEDALRYSLIMNMPENRDTNFNWKDFQIHTNSELVGILGNFINRVLVLTHKYCGSIVPFPGCFLGRDLKYLTNIHFILNRIDCFISNYKFRDALNEYMKIARLGNKYLTSEMPWNEKDHYRQNTIMNITLQIAGMITHLSYIFLPKTYDKLINMFYTNGCTWYDLENLTLFTPGHILNKNNILLFKKIEDNMIVKQIKKLKKK